ncbi:MAG TPA: OmpA family protein [Polyangiaceae bacterium]|nr:OmpA family protein [Polyangiaceae bacterium]
MRLRLVYSTWVCGALLLARGAQAEPLRLHGVAAAAHAVGGYQKDEFGWGPAGQVALELPFGRVLGLQLKLDSLWLSQGSAPESPRFERGGAASATSLGLGLRVRPFGASYQGQSASAAGLWLAADAGATLTNGLTRGMLDAQLGYDFLDHKGQRAIGPMLSLVHVFQPNGQVRPEDANILLLGVHAMYDFGPGLNPNSDRDHDGILDDTDKCPDVAEDKDGFRDDDGCPDDDNDLDGIADKVDHCPDVAEDLDGFEDADGCPEDDNDKDGIGDLSDKCPDVPEDKDGFEDEDGCPEPDNDKDGIADARDLCPNEPETVNGYADADGCPDEDQVRVVGDKIVLDDRVHFYVNSFIIRKISYPLLSRLSKLIAEHPEYVHVSVEGHADERGPDNFNQKLSEDRARAVMEFLVKQGIAQARLSSIGYGSTRPLVDTKSEYALLLNRRVEFTVSRQLKADGTPIVGAPSLNPMKETAPPSKEDAPAADESTRSGDPKPAPAGSEKGGAK